MTTILSKTTLALAVVALLATAVSAPNLLLNSGFEDPVLADGARTDDGAPTNWANIQHFTVGYTINGCITKFFQADS